MSACNHIASLIDIHRHRHRHSMSVIYRNIPSIRELVSNDTVRSLSLALVIVIIVLSLAFTSSIDVASNIISHHSI